MGNSQQTQRRQNLEAGHKFWFTCEICTETTPKHKKFNNKDLCKHPFCVDCIAKYLEIKIELDETAKIKCPGLDCEQLLDPLSCRPIIPQSIFSKWCDILFENSLLGFERTFCPNRDCMALVVNECGGGRGRVTRTQCPDCKQWFCFQCKVAWHDGYQCEESKTFSDPNDIMLRQLAPSHFGILVEREDGCRIINCRCKTGLCYECGGMIPCLCSRKDRREAVGNLILYLSILWILL